VSDTLGLDGRLVGGPRPGRTDQIPVPLEPAVRTPEVAAFWFGNPPLAGGAGGGGAPLIHQPHYHPGLLGLVAQRLQQVGAAPPPQPEVLHPTNVPVGDALGVAHHQGADALLDGEGDHLLGGLVLGLVDATAMPRLRTTHAPRGPARPDTAAGEPAAPIAPGGPWRPAVAPVGPGS
jgi:hypothetical protein